MIYTVNKLVACSPFPKQHVEKVVRSGIVMIDKKVQLQALEVVFDAIGPEQNTSVPAGSTVFVRGDTVVQPWSKEVFTEEGKEFILVPFSVIQFIKTLEV